MSASVRANRKFPGECRGRLHPGWRHPRPKSAPDTHAGHEPPRPAASSAWELSRRGARRRVGSGRVEHPTGAQLLRPAGMIVPMERDRTIAESRLVAEPPSSSGFGTDNCRAIYQELCISYRSIDDFRAKLLVFLPLASAGGIFLLLGPFGKNNAQYLLPVGLFGLPITLGLFSYESLWNQEISLPDRGWKAA